MPLGVETGINDPQTADGVQLQFTEVLLETVATISTLSPGWIVDGGAGLIFTEIAGVKDNTRLTLLLLSVTELAVSVAWPPEGRTAGAE